MLQGAELTQALYKLTTLMSTFEAEFKAMLVKEGLEQQVAEAQAQLDANTLTTDNVQQEQTTRNDQTNDGLVVSMPVDYDSQDEEDSDLVVRNVNANAGYESKQQQEALSVTLKPAFYKPSKLEFVQKAFASSITAQLINTVNQKFIKPVTSKLVNAGVDAMTKGFQNALNEGIKTFQSDYQLKKLSDRLATGLLDIWIIFIIASYIGVQKVLNLYFMKCSK